MDIDYTKEAYRECYRAVRMLRSALYGVGTVSYSRAVAISNSHREHAPKEFACAQQSLVATEDSDLYAMPFSWRVAYKPR